MKKLIASIAVEDSGFSDSDDNKDDSQLSDTEEKTNKEKAEESAADSPKNKNEASPLNEITKKKPHKLKKESIAGLFMYKLKALLSTQISLGIVLLIMSVLLSCLFFSWHSISILLTSSVTDTPALRACNAETGKPLSSAVVVQKEKTDEFGPDAEESEKNKSEIQEESETIQEVIPDESQTVQEEMQDEIKEESGGNLAESAEKPSTVPQKEEEYSPPAVGTIGNPWVVHYYNNYYVSEADNNGAIINWEPRGYYCAHNWSAAGGMIASTPEYVKVNGIVYQFIDKRVVETTAPWNMEDENFVFQNNGIGFQTCIDEFYSWQTHYEPVA